jgi:hypothetical protein
MHLLTATRSAGASRHSCARWSIYLLLLALCFGSSSVFAQNARIVHTVTKQKLKVGPAMGRDLWFSMAKNYDDQAGKYYMLYVTSPNNTNVHVQITGQGILSLPVQAYKVSAFNIPLGWEVKTSGVIEDKAIRVWSDDADITGYLMSHNPYTSDGMYIVPTIGWGTDYVVAAYMSLFEGFGSFVYDYPSEFVVISNQNNTKVDITPTQAIRGSSANVSLHPANTLFSDYLQRGQVVQYQLVQAQNADDYDVTGTIIHSNNPIGVVGGSTCPNIPPDYPYCDHICDMLPSVRTWATQYYSAPFIARKGGDTFLIIGTKAGQKIFRDGPVSGKHLFCVIDKVYGYFWSPDVDEASYWHSDQPFLLVQYINSATWPDNQNGDGDPAMVVVNSVEQYTPRVIFQTPRSVGNQSPYTNYANVIVNVNAAKSTIIDGKKITGYPKITIDGKYEIYRVGNLTPSAHEVKSDSGVGVYIYGYGFDESYAWVGALGTRTFNSPDTIPPVAVTSGKCFEAHVHFDDVHPNASKLNLLRVDTSYNMNYIPDYNWVEGSGMDSTYYDIFVLDNTKPASISVTTIDLAGNVTTVQSDYTPQLAVIGPDAQNFGTGSTTGPPVYVYDTITNIGTTDFNFNDLTLLKGNVGFHIDSADMSTLKPGEKRLIKISFLPQSRSTVGDTIRFGDPCVQQKVVLIGSGGQPDFYVTDYDWGKRPIGVPVTSPSPSAPGGVRVVNPSTQDIYIDQITVDSAQFVVDPTIDPVKSGKKILVPHGGSTSVPMIFTANYTGKQVVSLGHWRCDDPAVGSRDNTLKGEGIAPAQVFRSDTAVEITCPLGDTIHLAFYVEATGDVSTKVVKLEHSQAGNPSWVNLVATDQRYQPLDPNTTPVQLSNGMRMLVYLDYVPPTNQAGVFTDNITAYTEDDQHNLVPIKTTTAQVTVHYSELTASNIDLDFGKQVYGSPLTATQAIQIKNTAQEDATFDSVSFSPGSKNAGSFKIVGYTLNGSPVTPPVIVHANDVLLVNVAFDPSVSLDSSQTASLVAFYTACPPLPRMTLAGLIKSGGAYIQGYTSNPVLACANEQGLVVVGNPQHVGADETITGAVITGVNAANFAIPNIVGTVVPAQGKINVPVTFAPNAVAGQTVYNAALTVYLRGPLSLDTVSVPLTGTGVSVAALTSANMQTKADAASSHVSMPISVNVNMFGLTAPLESMRVSDIRLTFTFNTDLLSIEGSDPNSASATASAIANAMQNLPAGWTVDQANSSLTNGKLIVMLHNPSYMSANLTSLGDLNFKVTLPGMDTTRNVVLNSMELFADDGQGNFIPVEAGCVSTSVQSTDFTLVYQCGDSTLQQMMNGNKTFLQVVRPATPNPAADHVTFHYLTSVEQPVSLTIFDLLGNEIKRVMTHVDQAAGAYDVSYDVSSLPSGTYTYRLEGRGAVASKQFVVNH